MKQTIAESFYILIHHPDKPRIVVTETARNVGMIGAILLDLSIDEKITLEDGVVKVISTRLNLPDSHKIVLDRINDSARARKPKNWISRLAQTPGKPRRALLENLEKRSILELVPKRFLFIPYTQTWLLKRDVREKIIRQLRGIVFEGKELDAHMASLLGLIHATKMYKLIARTPEERKKCRIRLKEIVESNEFTKGVGAVVQEMQAAMMAAVIASSAASTAAIAGSS